LLRRAATAVSQAADGDRSDHPTTPRAQPSRAGGVDRICGSSTGRLDRISPRPLLMIAGTAAETAYFSEEAIKKADEPKELFWINGATHIDVYEG
jgi:fermentation-respiration switch protein FrsA (DUF1100 family)